MKEIRKEVKGLKDLNGEDIHHFWKRSDLELYSPF